MMLIGNPGCQLPASTIPISGRAGEEILFGKHQLCHNPGPLYFPWRREQVSEGGDPLPVEWMWQESYSTLVRTPYSRSTPWTQKEDQCSPLEEGFKVITFLGDLLSSVKPCCSGGLTLDVGMFVIDHTSNLLFNFDSWGTIYALERDCYRSIEACDGHSLAHAFRGCRFSTIYKVQKYGSSRLASTCVCRESQYTILSGRRSLVASYTL
ncbi:hypothetical protein EDD17DRAFT_1195990 [Pisolithus thermaeus]|nr:hypothetical protein EDD17DRAFT_1195990 [Pisolithus thermaeus]